jgi:hypothetical protein
MIERAKMRLSCPVCSRSDYLRVNAYTDVSAKAWSDGDVEFGFDYSDPELDPMREISCENCGIRVSLEEDEHKVWRLVAGEKLPFATGTKNVE